MRVAVVAAQAMVRAQRLLAVLAAPAAVVAEPVGRVTVSAERQTPGAVVAVPQPGTTRATKKSAALAALE
jgi:hypothetical protein